MMTLEGHTKAVWCIVTLNDGRIASGSSDCKIKVWDVVAARCVQTLEGCADTKAVRCLAALGDGRLASGSSDGEIRLFAAS